MFRLFLCLTLLMTVIGVTATPHQSADAQGFFGCPLPDQRDCDLLISGLENTTDLQSVYIEDLSVGVFVLTDGDTATFELSTRGATQMTDGDITGADWQTEVAVLGQPMGLGFRLIDGVAFMDSNLEDPETTWLRYDPRNLGADSFDLPGLFSTFTLKSLLDTLNEIGDGVTWTRGEDAIANGQTVAVFYADFSSASLVTTTFAYQQLTLLLTRAVQAIGIDRIDQNLIEFALDFLVNSIKNQLGGADFRITWKIGVDDQMLYGMQFEGAAKIDLMFLSFLMGGDGVSLPGNFSFSFNVNVDLSSHNQSFDVVTPDNVLDIAPELFQKLFDQLFLELLEKLLGEEFA